MSGLKRHAPSEWYTPYFAPTTIIIAITVLIVSVEAGRYVGSYLVQRDLTTTVSMPVANVAPARQPAHASAHKPHPKAAHATPSKTQP